MPEKAEPAWKPPVVSRPDDGGSQRTEQMRGGDGVFGVVYTMKAGYNLSLLKARYTLEPHNDYAGTMPQSDEKVLVLTLAVKNPQKDRMVDFAGFDFTPCG